MKKEIIVSNKDSYAKECIDTITSFLSENREDFVCIVAGYKEGLDKCFFKYNEGLINLIY